MNGVCTEPAGDERQRAARRQHARDLPRGELGVEKLKRIRDDHQVEGGPLERQRLGGGVKRAQREPLLRRRRAQLVEHLLRRLDRHHLVAPLRQREREVANPRAEIADPAADGTRQLGERVDQRSRVGRTGR